MLTFSKTIKIRVLCANLVERHWFDVSKKVANPKPDNFALLVWKMNLVKNQVFIGQTGENQPINILSQWFKFLFIFIFHGKTSTNIGTQLRQSGRQSQHEKF